MPVVFDNKYFFKIFIRHLCILCTCVCICMGICVYLYVYGHLFVCVCLSLGKRNLLSMVPIHQLNNYFLKLQMAKILPKYCLKLQENPQKTENV